MDKYPAIRPSPPIKTRYNQKINSDIIKPRDYPRLTIFLFLLMSAYLVMPIIDVPFMGLSLSAPIFFIITLQVLFKPPKPWLSRFRGWILLSALIWLGIFISTIFNGLLSGGVDIDLNGWLTILRYAYWLLTFVITAYFTSRGNMLERVSTVLGWAIFGLALVRLFEAFAWGKIGTWTLTRLLSQNSYGFLFSMFFPYLLSPIVIAKGRKRLFMIFRLLVVGTAVLINGSRGSWISVAAGILIFSVLFVVAKPQKIGWSIMIIIMSALIFFAVQFAPTKIASAFGQRFATFQTLEEDKSLATRELMVQKGVRLFIESPLIGVGASRFTKETTYLEIPEVLSNVNKAQLDTKSAHNSYISLLAESGLAGSLPYAILLLILGVRGLKSSIKLASKNHIWALSVIVSFLGMSIHMWAISTLGNTATWFGYGLVAAMIVVASKKNILEAAWD